MGRPVEDEAPPADTVERAQLQTRFRQVSFRLGALTLEGGPFGGFRPAVLAMRAAAAVEADPAAGLRLALDLADELRPAVAARLGERARWALPDFLDWRP